MGQALYFQRFSVKIVRVFPLLTPTDNTVTTSHSIPKESKALISFLNKLGTETKLQHLRLIASLATAHSSGA